MRDAAGRGRGGLGQLREALAVEEDGRLQGLVAHGGFGEGGEDEGGAGGGLGGGRGRGGWLRVLRGRLKSWGEGWRVLWRRLEEERWVGLRFGFDLWLEGGGGCGNWLL